MLTSRRAFCLALLTSLVVTPLRTEAQFPGEREVKAALLINFAKFTQWPAAAFQEATAPIVVGVAGDEVLRQTLENMSRGKLAGTRPLKTLNVRNANDVAGIHILYIGGTANGRAQELIESVGLMPILTVGDDDRFCLNGGMINFLSSDHRIRFEIRIDAAERSRLKVSSRVLTLAKTLYGTGTP